MIAEQRYVVGWRNLDNGKTGHGRKEMSLEECQALCETLNREYPNFEHVPADASGLVKPTFKTESPVVVKGMAELTDCDPMPFGEHKGKRMAQVPSDYLDWLQGQADLMAAWPQLDAYISRARPSIDQDLIREEWEKQ